MRYYSATLLSHNTSLSNFWIVPAFFFESCALCLPSCSYLSSIPVHNELFLQANIVTQARWQAPNCDFNNISLIVSIDRSFSISALAGYRNWGSKLFLHHTVRLRTRQKHLQGDIACRLPGSLAVKRCCCIRVYIWCILTEWLQPKNVFRKCSKTWRRDEYSTDNLIMCHLCQMQRVLLVNLQLFSFL